MKTVFCIGLLIVFGVVANFLAVFALNIVGLPGALLAGKPGERSKQRFIFGSLVAAVGQSYVYLAYVAFIVNWTRLAVARPDTVAWLLWPFAFLAAMLPVLICLLHGKSEAREQEFANPQVEALHITVIAAFVGFGLFKFLPVLAQLGWGWVPYID